MTLIKTNTHSKTITTTKTQEIPVCYIGCNAIWLMTFAHLKSRTKAQTKTQTETKMRTKTLTKTKCSKGLTYAIFFKSRWFKDMTSNMAI